MYSRTFSLFFAVACATFSIAAPLHDTPVIGGLVGNLGLDPREGLDALNGIVSEVESVAAAGAVPNLPAARALPDFSTVPNPLPRDTTAPLSGALGTVGGVVGSLTGAGVPTLGNPPIGKRDAHTNGAAGSIFDPLDTISVTNIPTPRAVAGHPSLPDICQDLTYKITPIVVKLEAAVSVKTDIKIEVVVGLLNDIVVLLKAAIVDVTVIVNDPTGFALTLAGTVISVEALVVLVAVLLQLLLSILLTVVVAVEGLAAGAVLVVVANIGGLVATLLALVIRLVPTLVAILLPKITVLVHVIYTLRLTDVVVVLGLPAHGY